MGSKLEHKKSIKNQSKIEAQDGSPLGIDFWWILVGFGSQVGVETRAKSDQKFTKCSEKMMNKKMRFGSPWVGGGVGRAVAAQGSWDPLITNF